MNKRIPFTLLAACLLFSLSGCGQESQTPDTVAVDKAEIEIDSSAIPDDDGKTHPNAAEVKKTLEKDVNESGFLASPYDSDESPVRITKIHYNELESVGDSDCRILCDITYEGDYFTRVDKDSFVEFSKLSEEGGETQWVYTWIGGYDDMAASPDDSDAWNFPGLYPLEGTEFTVFDSLSPERLLKDFKAEMNSETISSLEIAEVRFDQPTGTDDNGIPFDHAVLTYIVKADNGRTFTMQYSFDYMFLHIDQVYTGEQPQGEVYSENTPEGLKLINDGIDTLMKNRAESSEPEPEEEEPPAQTAPKEEEQYVDPAEARFLMMNEMFVGTWSAYQYESESDTGSMSSVLKLVLNSDGTGYTNGENANGDNGTFTWEAGSTMTGNATAYWDYVSRDDVPSYFAIQMIDDDTIVVDWSTYDGQWYVYFSR